MNTDGAQDFTAGGRWAHNTTLTWRPGMAPGAKELRIPRDAAVAEALPTLGQARGLWIDGVLDPEAIASLAALPSLRELHLPLADAAAAKALVALSKQIALERLRLIRVPAPLLVALEGLVVDALSVTVAPSGDGDAAGLTALFGLPLRELRVKAGGALALPTEAARALAATARVEELYAEGLGVTQEVVASLVQAPALTSLTLDKFGTPGALRVEGSSTLRRLELVGTNFDRLELKDLAALDHLRLFRPHVVHLTNLERLRFFEPPGITEPLELALRRLPVLEHVYGPSAWPSKLTLEEVPMLRAVDLDGRFLDAESAEALRRSGARLTLGRAEPTKHKKAGEKRKLKKNEWKNPRLGGSADGHGVLIAARMADDAVSGGKANELAVACEVWAQKLGKHLAGLVPLDLTRDLSYARVAPILVGQVVALVGAGQESAPIDVGAARAALEGLATLDDAFWKEACGIIGTATLSASAPSLYLVATGPDARATLRAGTEVVTWVDLNVVAWTAIDLDALEPRTLTLERS